MRILHLSLVIGVTMVMACSTLRAQDNPNAQQQPDQQQQTEQPQRPTLGKRAPGSASSPEGPHSATVVDERKLMHIRTLYVDRIDNQLSDKLMEALAKMGRFRIVAERKEADAVLTGTCFDSRHLKQLHSEVFLNDRASGSSIWQDVVRRPYNPPSLAESVQNSADLIVAHLNQTLREADRK
jgi:hemolysin activation/secretion protein